MDSFSSFGIITTSIKAILIKDLVMDEKLKMTWAQLDQSSKRPREYETITILGSTQTDFELKRNMNPPDHKEQYP